ncbi:MAG: transcription termination/antitermination factor NusG [Fimbriimonadaceae bacterium]|nr:transcription termination/antitermination factor NusG [Fimbriimonadaceae bacterium]
MAFLWYAVHTFTGQEDKVSRLIERAAVTQAIHERIREIYVPVEEEVSSVGGKKRTIKRKLFPGYIFIHMDLSEDIQRLVKNTNGVTGFMGADGEPSPLEQQEVSSLLRIREEPEEVQTSAYGQGDRVRIVGGPFAEFSGRIEEVNLNKETVRVMISIFGRDTPVELKFTEVEREE